MTNKNENTGLSSPLGDRGINILMTGAGAPGAAGIINCLNQEPSFHIVTADANPEAVGRWLSKDFELIPMAKSKEFIDVVIEVCRKRNIHVILPLVTRELLPLAHHIKEIELAGCRLISSTAASLEIANNKSRLYEFLQNNGIAVPEFKNAKSINEFLDALRLLGCPDKAVCFKPSVSNGSRGFRIISKNINELDLLLNHKPDHIMISREQALRILSSGEFPELLVSEYLPGEEYSVDCLVKNGNPVLIVPRKRIRTINGISVEGELVKNEKIISYCSRIIEALQLHGNIGIQVKQAANGNFLILEINPRVQGTIAAALGAGVNLPVLVVKQELGLPISETEMEVKWGTKFSRYWSEVFY